MSEKLEYKIEGDASGLKKALQSSLEMTNKLTEKIGDVGKELLAIAGLKLSFDFLKESFEMFAESEAAVYGLKRAVGASGGLASDLKELNEVAEELKNRGIFDDDDIRKAMTMQLQMGLTADKVKQLTPLIADMTAGFITKGGEKLSVEAMTGEVDKYLRTGKSKVLAGLGITGGNTQAERMSLLQKGSKQFEGADVAAVLNTTEGKIANLKHKFDDVKKGVGEGLASAFTAVFPYLQQFGSKLLEIIDWVKENKELFSNFFGGMISSLKPLTDLFMQVFNGLKPIVMSLFSDLFNIGKKYFDGFKSIFNNIIADISKLITPILQLINFLKPYFLEFVEGILIFGRVMFDYFQKVFDIGYSIYQILNKLGLFTAIGKIFSFVWETLKAIGNSLVWIYDNIISPILTKFELALNALKKIMGIKDEKSGSVVDSVVSPFDKKSDDKKVDSLFTGQKTTADLSKNDKDTKKETTRESITLNIHDLVEKIEIHTTNLSESTAEIKQKIAEALQEAVLSVRYGN